MRRLTTVMMVAAATLAVAAPAQAVNLDSRWAITHFPGLDASGAAGVAVQPDGGLVLAGSSYTYDEDSESRHSDRARALQP